MSARPHFSRRLVACALACLLAGFGLSTARAYVLSGQHWPEGQPIMMYLGLGTPDKALTDGSATWNAVAEAALGVWNPYLDNGVKFEWEEEATGAGGNDDGKNEVFFSDTLYGESFGDDTLATTLSTWDNATNIKSEADVVVNNTVPYDSYRGDLEIVARHYVYDLRRVLLHEFGHVLGLAHVSQDTQSIMTPVTTDIDTIQPDDIAGVEAIYGNPHPEAPSVATPGTETIAFGQPINYQVYATNDPTSYQASGLPAGVSIDATTGFISGKPLSTGVFQITLAATNAGGTGTAMLTLTIYAVPAITGPTTARGYVGYPFYYRITASGGATSYTASDLPSGLSLDASTGLISGVPTGPGNGFIELTASNGYATSIIGEVMLTIAVDASISVLHSFPYISADGSELTSLVKGQDGNLYGTTMYGGPGLAGIFFRCAPDGTFTELRDFGPLGPMQPVSLSVAPDGTFYGTTNQTSGANYPSIFRITPGGGILTVFAFPNKITGAPYSHLSAILASDGNYYGSVSFTIDNAVSYPPGFVFKVTPDGVFTKLHDFDATGDSCEPCPLTEGPDGAFYGATSSDAIIRNSTSRGTIFRVTADRVFTTLHTFTSNEGAVPRAQLLLGPDGNFYGTTLNGGTDNVGTIFKVTPQGTLTTLHSLSLNSEGHSLYTKLVEGYDGAMYGITGYEYEEGPPVLDNGVIYRITRDGKYNTLHPFAYGDGAQPFLPLLPNPDGTFYGGSSSLPGMDSTIFKFTPGAKPPVSPAVTLAATTPKVTLGSGDSGTFTLTLATPQTTPIIVYYTLKGSAINGTDYTFLKGKVKIKPGKTSKTIQVVPQGDLGGEYSKKVKLALQPDPNYAVGTTGPAKVKIISLSGGAGD